MTHFGFLAPPYLGHVNPMAVLARGLVARGHDATFFGLADAPALIADPTLPFAAVGQVSHPPGTLARMTQHMARPNGSGLFRVMADMAALTDMLCRELPAGVRERGINAIVTDQLEPAGGLVAEALGLAHVSVANALPINREPLIPPPFTGWSYVPSGYGLWRNRGGYRVADRLMRPMSRVIGLHAERFGLPSRTRLDQCLSDTLEVSQMIDGLDFPRHAASPAMNTCGPFREESRAVFDDAERDGRPLVFATLGSLQGGRIALFRHIAAACMVHGMQLVIAHGGRLDPYALDDLPGRPIVRSFVPQAAVLREASLAITNGGLNTVLDSLAAGVPLIVLPIAFEQGAIAARVARRGVGLSLSPRRRTAGALAHAIGVVLGDIRYGDRAAELAYEIRAAGGATRALDLIEAATGGASLNRSVDFGSKMAARA